MFINIKEKLMPIHPIGFSIHESLIVKEVPKKKKLLAHIIPGKLETYIFNSQEEYNKDYQESYFAMTYKKSGWDCFRHYEILANGCIPYFINLEGIPKNIMTHFPKEIIQETNKLYVKMRDEKDLESEDYKKCIQKCNEYIEKLLDYTRKHLTTRAMATYMLEKAGFDVNHVKRVLILSEKTEVDYLRCLTVEGLKDLYGKDCHDFPKIPHIYQNYSENIKNLYGKGINYSKLFSDDCYDQELDQHLIQNIKNHYYDVVIYGSVHRGMPLISLISSHYEPKEVIYLCGEDQHNCAYKKQESSLNIFIRELN